MIPWDDDIDIAMPREDYKKLKKIAKKKLGIAKKKLRKLRQEADNAFKAK